MITPNRIAQTLINLVTSARFVVDGDSMLPSLRNHQWVLAARPNFSWNQLRRGDIVVLQHPVWPGRISIKRVVGLPSEEIRLMDGLIHLNSRLLGEPYLGEFLTSEETRSRPEYDRQWWTENDEYFVLGDNRQDSLDSRLFGPIESKYILGRVWLRCWPPKSFGKVQGGRVYGDGELGN